MQISKEIHARLIGDSVCEWIVSVIDWEPCAVCPPSCPVSTAMASRPCVVRKTDDWMLCINWPAALGQN